MQIQAVADKLAGLHPDLNADQFADPWKTCWQALQSAGPGQAHVALIEAFQDNPQRDWIFGAIFEARPGEKLGDYPSLKELAERLPPIEWLWTGWIPRGMITLLGAVPGAGKSFVALDIARRIIHGESFPDGQPVPSPEGNVVYVDAEAVPQLLNERAKAWELDTGRLFVMLPVGDQPLDFSELGDRDRLVEMATSLEPELIVVDSLSSITTRGENSIEDVRAVLSFLNRLAQDFRVPLLLVHHLRKGSSYEPRSGDLSIDDFRGSGHIITMARSVLGLSLVQTGPSLDRNGPRKLELIKTNLGRYPDPLGVEFVPLNPLNVRLVWGEPPRPYREPTKLEGCKSWLEGVLRESPEGLRPKELIELAGQAGYSRAAVYRAREELGPSIENTLGRRHPQNAWRWVDDPGAETPEAEEQPEHEPPSREDELG